MKDTLFETRIINDQGLNGTAYVDQQDGLRVVTSNPVTADAGTNPEELLGLAFSTCLNATIEAVLEGEGLSEPSKVVADIQLKKESNASKGYFFDIQIYAAIKDIPFSQAEKVVKNAKSRCPIAKLLQGATTLSIEVIEYSKLVE